MVGVLSLTALSLAVSSGWLTPQHSAAAEGITRGVLGGVALLSGYIALRILMNLPEPARPHHDPAYQPNIDWVAQLQLGISAPRLEHQPKALLAFMDLITTLTQHRSRVVETIDLDGRSINKQVSIEFVLPESAMDDSIDSLYLPILQPVIGDLVDNFRLTDSSNNSVTNLSYLETVELAAIGLRTLLIIATGKQFNEWTDTRAGELILLELIARRRPTDPDSVKSSTDKGLALLEGSPNKEIIEIIRSYLVSLSTGYPIVASVPRNLLISNRVLLKYGQTITPASSSKGWEGKLRLGIGVRPSQITVPVDLAQTAGSYHLRINGPPEKYVAEQILRCAYCRVRLDDPPPQGPPSVSTR